MAYIRPIAWDPGFTIDEMLPPEPLRRQELLCSQLQGAHRLRWGTHPPLKPSQRSNPGQKRIVRRHPGKHTRLGSRKEQSGLLSGAKWQAPAWFKWPVSVCGGTSPSTSDLGPWSSQAARGPRPGGQASRAEGSGLLLQSFSDFWGSLLLLIFYLLAKLLITITRKIN